MIRAAPGSFCSRRFIRRTERQVDLAEITCSELPGAPGSRPSFGRYLGALYCGREMDGWPSGFRVGCWELPLAHSRSTRAEQASRYAHAIRISSPDNLSNWGVPRSLRFLQGAGGGWMDRWMRQPVVSPGFAGRGVDGAKLFLSQRYRQRDMGKSMMDEANRTATDTQVSKTASPFDSAQGRLWGTGR